MKKKSRTQLEFEINQVNQRIHALNTMLDSDCDFGDERSGRRHETQLASAEEKLKKLKKQYDALAPSDDCPEFDNLRKFMEYVDAVTIEEAVKLGLAKDSGHRNYIDDNYFAVFNGNKSTKEKVKEIADEHGWTVVTEKIKDGPNWYISTATVKPVSGGNVEKYWFSKNGKKAVYEEVHEE